MSEKPKCPLSGQEMEHVFSAKVLRKYEVNYYYCKESGLLKTETPYWLDESYTEAINDTDTGLVNRNISNSNMLEIILERLSISKGKLLDVAGGYGLLTRLLRDKGFDCYTTDKYCQNLFAKTFEPAEHFQADALFAFEVLEHVAEPLQFMSELFSRYGCRTIIFSTLTFSGPIPPKKWWYYSFEGGQHITFYQPRTLSILAVKLDCKYYKLNSGLHMITNHELSPLSRLVFSNKYFNKLYSSFVQRRRSGLSKTWSDHLKMKEHL